MTGWRMRPTASALGVIAIVSVMITATPSGADSGAIEPIINHPEEDQHVQEDESAANQTATDDLAVVTVHALANDTASEVPVARDSRLFRVNRENDSQTNEESIVVEPQRDQSDAAAASNDVHQSEHNDPEDKAQQDSVASTQSNVMEIASISPLEVRPPDPKIPEDLSNVVEDQFDDSNVEKSRKEESVRFTTASVRETIATELKPIEQKSVDDIRAISFQVPAIAEKAEDKEQDNEESMKDLSKPVNNLVLTGGKSTKAFYEIKPSIKTEMEGEIQQSSSTLKPLGRKFVMPSVDSAFGKFGPYFEDGDQEVNITARIGSTMLLDCKIGMLGDKKVTWVQQHSKDSFRLLTVGRIPYSVDQRISLDFRYPSNWRLQILYATPRDSGLYKCQVATHPPLVKTINVVVTAPELTITDDSGRVVPKERHLKAGSALKLRCEARDIIESLKESVVWTRGDETLTEDVSENRTTEIFAGREILVIVSTLIVERASPRHAGNYSCEVPGKAKTTIAVHVLNGELPAAVHDGNGVSRAFLNLWLIHLTMSYVFSR